MNKFISIDSAPLQFHPLSETPLTTSHAARKVSEFKRDASTRQQSLSGTTTSAQAIVGGADALVQIEAMQRSLKWQVENKVEEMGVLEVKGGKKGKKRQGEDFGEESPRGAAKKKGKKAKEQ